MGLFDLKKMPPKNVAGIEDSRFIEPSGLEEIPAWRVKYSNAKKLADDLGEFPDGFRAFCISSGKFIAGDFIEAIIVKNKWVVEDLTISTLSMSQENIDSLKNLITWGMVGQLNLIVSDWFFASERRNLIPYMYKELDVENRFQVAVASMHTKVSQIRTTCGKKITIHGSANLRSSGSVEQMMIETDHGIYDFMHQVHHSVIDLHATINKRSPREILWSAIMGEDNETTEKASKKRKKTVGV